jgi:diguanylate cyclase (GGDEF)-like protein/PAS domain S-box-containing protein
MRQDALSNALAQASDSLLATYPDGAVLINDQGHVIANDAKGGEMAEIITAKGGKIFSGLTKTPVPEEAAGVFEASIGEGGRFEVAAVPLADGGGILMLGRGQSLEKNMIAALIESRARYKDFVETSSDFTWETGPDGSLIFVSPTGALDFTPSQLIGRSPEDVFEVPGLDPSPFKNTELVRGLALRMRRADGEMTDLVVSIKPVFGAAGEWCGARGVCRDVTEQERDRLALAEAEDRERLLDALMAIMRDEVEPAAAIEKIINHIEALDVIDGCNIYGRDEFTGAGDAFKLISGSVAQDMTVAEDDVLAAIGSSEDITEVAAKSGPPALLVSTGYLRRVNGATLVWRRDGAWRDEDKKRVAALASLLGIAIERLLHHERILTLSRTDELTGLMNRRAFMNEEMPRRLARLQKGTKPAVLMFLDLDNFKLVNDAHGHGRGDRVLVEIARFLGDHSRSGDLVARLGGDEFAMWFDGMDGAGAAERAGRTLENAAKFKDYSGDAVCPFGISIGIAICDPGSNESIEDIVARADVAMYEIKRQGKGGLYLSEAPDH